MSKNIAIFRRYRWIMTLTFLTISCVFIFIFLIQFRAQYENELNRSKNRFQQHAFYLDQLVQNGADYVNAMALQANRFLDQNSDGEKRSGLFQWIENNPEGNHFSLDGLVSSIKTEYIGNLQGMGAIEDRAEVERLEIEMALSLNPLFQVIKHNLPNVAWVYYLSKNSFCNIYPWVPTATMKLDKDVYETIGYQSTTPENDPEKEIRWSSVYVDFAGKGLMITCAKPIYWKGQYWGQVGLDVTLDILSKHSKGFQPSAGISFLVNDDDQLIAHPNLVQASDTTIKEVYDAFPAENRNRVKDLMETTPLKTTNVGSDIAFYTPLKNAPWKLVYRIPQRELLLGLVSNFGVGFFIIPLALIVMLVVSQLAISKEFVQPAKQLITHIENESRQIWASAKFPVAWSPWFELISETFRQNFQLNTELEIQVKKRTEFIREIFGRYLTDEVVENLLEAPEGLKVGGDTRRVTILLSDLREFTPLSEGLPPEKTVMLINTYLEAMTDTIMKYGGTIDEILGDGIMVIFGAPIWKENDEERAVACAVEMQLVMEKVNQQNREAGLPEIEMGIGVNTGEVVVGNIGSLKRAKYGVVGSHVNLTARIESYAKGGQIFISDETLKSAGSIVKINQSMEVEFKGFTGKTTIHEVGGILGSYNLNL